MRGIVFVAGVIVGLSVLLADRGGASDREGIPPETVADYIHAVIEADRTFYTVHVVERMQKEGGSVAAEDWRAKTNRLPLPAQFLMESSELAAKTGVKVRYRLISLWPINPQNAPYDQAEKAGLEAVRDHPDRASTGTVKIGDQRYFQAIYADHAVTKACIDCHNQHPSSPKKDFKLNDVMGGLVIEIPIGR
ncbi:MAG: DUF3365 domain-containing protein [Nitrospira sp.]|nr:DUF3365 domain-containing protein [Nitrospira sp.]